MKDKFKDTKWIFGLKILAALLVVLHHYTLIFYPAFFNLNEASVRTSSAVELTIAKTPFNIFSWSGNVCVCIFFILSGFLLSYKFFYEDKTDVKKTAITRYFKLALPVLFSSIIYYIVIYLSKYFYPNLICSSVMGSTGQLCNYSMNFFEFLFESIFGFFISGNSSVNPVIWTMRIELIGSIIVLAFLHFFGKNKNRYRIYILLLILLSQTSIFPLVLGMMLCDICKNKKFDNILNNKFVHLLLIIIGLYFCGFTYESHLSKIYNFLPLMVNDSLLFYHTLGAFSWLLAITHSPIIKRILSFNIFGKFANLSISIYLFHWLILNTISILIMSKLINYMSYGYSFIIMFVLSLLIIILISYFLGEKVIYYTNKITDSIYNKYLKE